MNRHTYRAPKRRINISLDADLHEKAKRLARDNHTDFSGLLTQILVERTQAQGSHEQPQISRDKKTGIMVVARRAGAPALTTKKVKALLAEFP